MRDGYGHGLHTARLESLTGRDEGVAAVENVINQDGAGTNLVDELRMYHAIDTVLNQVCQRAVPQDAGQITGTADSPLHPGR